MSSIQEMISKLYMIINNSISNKKHLTEANNIIFDLKNKINEWELESIDSFIDSMVHTGSEYELDLGKVVVYSNNLLLQSKLDEFVEQVLQK